MLIRLTVVLLVISGIFCTKLDFCDSSNSVNISSGTVFPNGEILANGIRYNKNEYYYESGNLWGCKCKKKKCIKKCCPIGQGYHLETRSCVNITEDFNPPVWDKYRKLDGIRAGNLFRFVPGKINCTDPEYRMAILSVLLYEHIHLIKDGSLYVKSPNRIPPWTIREADTYCIDTFVFDNPDGTKTTSMDALGCFLTTEEEHYYLLTSSCMLISCVFILATCAVYAWLPELRNLHGKVLMAYLLCLFLGFCLFSAMQILLYIDNINASACIGLTIAIYFSLLSAFFWLNVMCFDIWWTFSGKRGLSLEKLSTQGRFYAYATYAFSIPTALTVLMTALEFSGLPPHPWLPMLQQQGCFLYGNGKLIYFYGPIVVLCVANMIFFILTAVKITQIKKQTAVLKSKESSRHDQHKKDKQRFVLYIKLFAVMGINWILEVISSLYPDIYGLWRVTDVYNVLIGVTIFIIFVCKRKIYYLIKKRYRQMRGLPPVWNNQTTISSRVLSREDTQVNSIKLQAKQTNE